MKHSKPLPKNVPLYDGATKVKYKYKLSSIITQFCRNKSSCHFFTESNISFYLCLFVCFSEQVVLIMMHIWLKGRLDVITFITLTFQKKVPKPSPPRTLQLFTVELMTWQVLLYKQAHLRVLMGEREAGDTGQFFRGEDPSRWSPVDVACVRPAPSWAV